jgi:gliding motility-associated-like protein
MNKILIVSLILASPFIINDRDSPGIYGFSTDTDFPLPLNFTPAPQLATSDFGDAPLSYGSADHVVTGNNYLGSVAPDKEPVNQPSPEADADDLTGIDDEDGVIFPEMFPGARVTIQVKITGLAYLNAWVDWNGDGDFNDNSERIASNSLRSTGTASLSVTVPSNAVTSKPTFARFRFGPNSTNKPTYGITGSATFGEVEDYLIKISCIVPDAPKPGTVTQPDCGSSTGSVVLNGLPSSGTWTLTRLPDGALITGSGTTVTVSDLPAGTYSFTVTNSSGCTSAPSEQIIIIEFAGTPSPPVAETIIQPTCTLSTGGVVLTGLPASGTWTLTRYPEGLTVTGTGTTTTVSGLTQGTYTFTVMNSAGCTSLPSAGVVINQQPPTPTAPVPGTITHPTCEVPTGSVIITGLPSTGTWTLTRFPGSIQSTGTGTGTTVSGLGQGTYNFTVANADGCTSPVSSDVVINLQPGPAPVLVITNPAPVCSPSTVDLTNAAVTQGSTPGLTFSYWTDAAATVPYATPAQATAGTYWIKGITISGCSAIKPVIVTVLQKPSANAGPDLILEYLFSTTLQAEEPGINLTGTWTVVKGSGEFADPGYARTTVSKLAVGENVLSWTVTNGVCQPALDYVSITVTDLLIPTLITPDMNGKNDYFVIKGIETLGNTSLTVCDRRGMVVYENKTYDNLWHGLDYNGNPLPSDTYFFLLKPENGRSVTGYLVIRR